MSAGVPIVTADEGQHQNDANIDQAGSDNWPRSWQDASSWVSRDPAVAGSFQSSFIRTRHPELLDSEQAARSPLLKSLSGHRSIPVTEIEDLEEALLFEFEDDEAAPAETALILPHRTAAHSSTVPRLRSISRTATGTHVQTDTYLMQIEEQRATSSSWQAGLNAINILCGVGLLTTPYALAITGTTSLLLLIGIGAIACYTGRLLALCMNSSRSITTYPDIGQAAFGRFGRLLVSVLLYMELFSCCVDFLILEGDNLSAIWPGAALSILGYHLTAKQTLILLAALVVLPSVWLRDLSLLSYLSVGGIFASIALLGLVGWEGATITGFTHSRPPLVVWSGVPVSIGIFCFCFSGHAVFPSLYASMRNKSHFPWLLLGSFAVVIVVYGSMAVLGAVMFGPTVSENITLDMQAVAPNAMPTVLGMWLVIINPVSKIALTLAPVAMAVEVSSNTGDVMQLLTKAAGLYHECTMRSRHSTWLVELRLQHYTVRLT
eukprot:GHRR01033314.1.p1 GENE.GHRR01033314.1~~GHRR01033314.1.p1  ORF type:complete len:491 (+),score=123.32 GHRR01033314.1:299-1771(+)